MLKRFSCVLKKALEVFLMFAMPLKIYAVKISPSEAVNSAKPQTKSERIEAISKTIFSSIPWSIVALVVILIVAIIIYYFIKKHKK